MAADPARRYHPRPIIKALSTLDTPLSVVVQITAHPHAHRFTVCLRVQAPQALAFSLPRWIRGSYLIRDFAKHVQGLQASRNGLPVAVTRLDASSFSVPAGDGTLRLDYQVHALDESVRKAYLDTRRGFFNASSLVYLPQGHRHARYQLHLPRPSAPECAHWQLATALTPLAVDADGFGEYQATDYETLLDSPVEMAAFKRIDFVADDIPHTLTLSGRCTADEARLAKDLAQICTLQRHMFGSQPAMPRYWFLTNVTAASYGGLEHKESTALVCARHDLPQPGNPKQSREYRRFLGLCSHEYFHLWNVKRITPQAFAESHLQAPAYSQDLWHYEGVTSYYDDLFLLRAKLIDAPQYLDLLAETATSLERSPARLIHSLADASWETWIKYYQPDENSVNASTNYYTKGALVALLLDLHLRLHSAICLDDVMRGLWQRYQQQPAPEGALATLAAELSGLDLSAFFALALHSTAELPLAETLAEFGVTAHRRPSQGDSDMGGRNSGLATPVLLGFKLKADGSVAQVLAGSPAEACGLAAGDQPVAIDHLRISPSQLPRRLEGLSPGQPVPLVWLRNDELMQAAITPLAAPADTWTFSLASHTAGPALARRLAWLGV